MKEKVKEVEFMLDYIYKTIFGKSPEIEIENRCEDIAFLIIPKIVALQINKVNKDYFYGIWTLEKTDNPEEFANKIDEIFYNFIVIEEGLDDLEEAISILIKYVTEKKIKNIIEDFQVIGFF